MTNTVTAYKLDIRYLAEAYESLMRMERHGTTFHMGSHGPRNVLNTYKCMSYKLGVKLINDHVMERIEELVDEDEERRKAVALRIFGSKKEAV